MSKGDTTINYKAIEQATAENSYRPRLANITCKIEEYMR